MSSRSTSNSLPKEESVDTALRYSSRLLMQRLLQGALLFVSGLVVARALGPAERAQYALPLALATATWTIINLSLDQSTGGMLARGEASLSALSRFLSAAVFVLGTVGFVACTAIGIAIASPLLHDATPMAIAFAALTIPPVLATQMHSGLLARLGALQTAGWAIVGGTFLSLSSLLAIALLADLTVERALACYLLGTVGIALPMSLAVRLRAGRGALTPAAPLKIAGRAISAGAVLHPGTIGLYLNLSADLFIVGALRSARDTGLYSVSAALANTVFLAVWTVSAAAAATQTTAPLDEASAYTADFIRQSLLLTVAAAVLVCIFAPPLILFLYGQEWAGSALPLIILAFAAVALAIEAPARLLLVRMQKLRPISAASCTAFALNVALNFALVPILGIIGAALASLVSYWCYGLILLSVLRRTTGVPFREIFRRPAPDDLVARLPRQLLPTRFRRSR